MRKIAMLISAIFIMCSFSACKIDLYQYMIIKGFGIDKENNEYKISVRYASLDEQEPEKLMTVSGETVYDALNKISLTSGKKPLYSGASYIICGSRVASEGLEKCLDFFIRYFKAKPVLKLYVASEKASDVLETENDDKLIPSQDIVDCTENSENKGKTVSATVMSFIADSLSESKSSIVPIINLKDEEISCTSSAVFQDYAMKLNLDENLTRAYLTLKGQLENSSVVVNGEKGEKITAEIQNVKSKINSDYSMNLPQFDIDININAVLVAIPFNSEINEYEQLEIQISKKIEQYIILVLQAKKFDILSFSNIIYLENSEYWKENKNNFYSNLENIKINLNIQSKITRVGEEDNPII